LILKRIIFAFAHTENCIPALLFSGFEVGNIAFSGY